MNMETHFLTPRCLQRGFTLLEIVIAIGLFSIGLLGMCSMLSGFMNSNTTARHRTDATTLAHSQMETLVRNGYTEISDSIEENLNSSGVPGEGVFQREVAVVQKTDPVCKEVTVTVSWRFKGDHRVVLKTILAPE